MSYSLCDSRGYITDFASIGGLSDFRAWAEQQGAPLRDFVEQGHTTDLEALVKLLEGLEAPLTIDDQVQLLLASAAHAKDVLILSDGASNEEKTPRTLGDVEGHPFHGNQWTTGEVLTGSDDLGGRLNDARQQISDRIAQLEKEGNDDPDNHEFAALSHMDTAISIQLDAPLSQRQYLRSSFVFDGEKIVGAAVARMSTNKKTAEILNVGAVKHGAGKLLIDSLHTQLRERGVKTVTLTSTAGHFYERQGYKVIDNASTMTRTLAGHSIVAAADSLLPFFDVAIRSAFAAGRRAITAKRDAADAVASTLAAVLPAALHRATVAGGHAGTMQIRAAGDVEGHPFHGNQWTSGQNSQEKQIEKPRYDEIGKARTELATINGGVSSTLDDHTPTLAAFSNTLRSLHNQNDLSPMIKYSQDHPKEFARMQRVMRFDAWVHSDSKLSFQKWEDSKIKVYRGVSVGASDKGAHWTTDERIAHAFTKEGTTAGRGAYENGSIGHVISREITPREMFAYSDAQGEREVILRGLRAAKKTTPFNETDARIRAWVTKHAGEAIKGISKTTRQDIATVIANRAEMSDAQLFKAIRTAVGDSDRAQLIARTESMRAAHAGQRIAWQQGVDAGIVPPGAKRVWIVTDDDRLCPDCADLDGETANIDGEYDAGYAWVDGPPLHPQCRCTEGLE